MTGPTLAACAIVALMLYALAFDVERTALGAVYQMGEYND